MPAVKPFQRQWFIIKTHGIQQYIHKTINISVMRANAFR